MLGTPKSQRRRGPSCRTGLRATTVMFSMVCGAVVLTVALVGCKATSSGPLSTAVQEKGMTAGRPFADPPDADTASPAHLTVTLDAAATRFDVGGRPVWG